MCVIESEFEQEMLQSQTADQPQASGGTRECNMLSLTQQE